MPLFYSEKEAKENNIGWYRAGYNIAYYASSSSSNRADLDAPTRAPGSKKSKSDDIQQFYTLSFKFTLKHDDDVVYIAMCYPYTFTDCVKFLDGINGPEN